MFADIVGMIGTVLTVAAFFLNQVDRIDPKGLPYNIMNLVGAILLLISLSIHFNLASFVIEVFWIFATIVGLYRYHQRNKRIKELQMQADSLPYI
ncbi:CBU_0592 family membrane protein [Thalassotalea maritima]|uniref:CBU_0592 family membrane protein n=1 Tax=Thalassotalea maritima TaxID=3242416 RepID=UPI003528373A